ncbi:MAG: hypothetical protein ACI8RZ_001080 [Myxococcota bacterium]|jgi:hypothetical protein
MDLTHQQTALSGTEIDIGAALEFAKSDPDWLKKCGMHGLVMLIPIAGLLALQGWTRKVYDNAKSGERTLPDLDIGSEVSYGITPLVAMLNVVAITLPLMIVIWIVLAGLGFGVGAVGGAMGEEAAGIMGILMMVVSLVVWLVFMVVMLGVQLLVPEIQRRGYNGEMGPLFSPGASIRAVKANPKAYLMTFVGLFVANLIASLGAMACYVGMFITMPFGSAMAAHLLAQWDAIVQRSEAA